MDCDVVVVGAGLAGLNAAVLLAGAGLDVRVLEAGDDVGGRVRTDDVDGMLLDRGFQLYNPAYPESRRRLDHAALELRGYAAGVVVALDGRRHRVGDPRRVPQWAVSSLRAPVAPLATKVRLAMLGGRLGLGPVRAVEAAPDSTIEQALEQRGLAGPLTERVLRPFLAGVFGEDELRTSRRFADLVLRSFVRGTPSVPAHGMGQIPRQLAARLPAGSVTTGTRVHRVAPGRVESTAGSLRTSCVVVATDAAGAADLLPGLDVPPANALTTLYHAAPQPPTDLSALFLDGERRGPVVNTSVISNVAPAYARGRALVSSSVLGARDDPATEAAVRAHLSVIYGTDTGEWEHVATYALPNALPAMLPPLQVRRPVALGDRVYVCGDHRDTASIQGAMVSGRRAAAAVLRDLGRNGRAGPRPGRRRGMPGAAARFS